ncbi:MAG: hypothetical protein DCC49_02620 [Acidobacteria bacterium]|nr:MAG: hypothetical protein DCC49_02620 [Acidobacteriota bacterium]
MDSATSRGRGRRLAIVLVALASAAMLLLGACGGGDKKTDDTKAASPASTAKSGGSGGEEVKVKLTEYKFDTPMTSFASGKAYKIEATNAGVMEHNLHVFKKGERDESKAVAKIPTADLGAGKSASTTMTLPAAGDYEFVCTVPGHEQLGMKLDIKAT